MSSVLVKVGVKELIDVVSDGISEYNGQRYGIGILGALPLFMLFDGFEGHLI
jgi:hypothetical protein